MTIKCFLLFDKTFGFCAILWICYICDEHTILQIVR